jgi:hypothetical protein
LKFSKFALHKFHTLQPLLRKREHSAGHDVNKDPQPTSVMAAKLQKIRIPNQIDTSRLENIVFQLHPEWTPIMRTAKCPFLLPELRVKKNFN